MKMLMTTRTSRPVSENRVSRMKLPLAVTVLVLSFTVAPAQAQSFSVIHTFSGGPDGAVPEAGLTIDGAGNLYGTTEFGGSQVCGGGCGTVFKLSYRGGGWVLTTIYGFIGYLDSGYPVGRVVFGPDGALYGTTSGGEYCDLACGTVFRLAPPATPCRSITCPWTKTILYRFQNSPDGATPEGDLVFDAAGNLYGTTMAGGAHGLGTVYKLTHSNGNWTQSVLYSFAGLPDGASPVSGVVFDNAGNLYGTTPIGGNTNPPRDTSGLGVIFKLTPSGSGWTESVLHAFTSESSSGQGPYGGLTFDSAGNFYGATLAGGGGFCLDGGYEGCGTVYQGAGNTIYTFTVQFGQGSGGPLGPMTLDAQGNLYGASSAMGADYYGNVFELTAGQYAYTSLYSFTGGSDGRTPVGNVVFDRNGNLYGVTSRGGTQYGVVWEITP